MDINEQCCPTEEYDVPLLYYCANEGIFIDEDGVPVFNIYDYITPGIHQIFLHNKDSDIFQIQPGRFIELVYQDMEPVEMQTIYYYSDEGIFVDSSDDHLIVHDVPLYIGPIRLQKFIEDRESRTYEVSPGFFMELIYWDLGPKKIK